MQLGQVKKKPLLAASAGICGTCMKAKLTCSTLFMYRCCRVITRSVRWAQHQDTALAIAGLADDHTHKMEWKSQISASQLYIRTWAEKELEERSQLLCLCLVGKGDTHERSKSIVDRLFLANSQDRASFGTSQLNESISWSISILQTKVDERHAFSYVRTWSYEIRIHYCIRDNSSQQVMMRTDDSQQRVLVLQQIIPYIYIVVRPCRSAMHDQAMLDWPHVRITPYKVMDHFYYYYVLHYIQLTSMQIQRR